MLISAVEEQMSLPTENINELSDPSALNLNSDLPNGLRSSAEYLDFAPFTDVGVVPEHEKHELEQSILNLEGEIGQLKLNLKKLDENRKEALNKILDIKGSIRVFCRVRPFLLSDKRRRIYESVSTEAEKVIVSLGGARKEFEFDKVFPQEAHQEFVFDEVEPIIRSALDGHNVCVLAYGQTGTGKTFTMEGTNEQPGIIPRAIKELFRLASLDNSSSISFSMSMLEVYMGNLRDLLAPKSHHRGRQPVTKCILNIQTDPKGSVEIEGLSEVQILDYAKALWWYNKGRRVRSTSWTNVNEVSSRSHCLTRIAIFRKGDASESKVEISKLWMIDLGGSERLLKTGATGLTLDEGRAINLSLSALGDVIAALRRKRCHVPYRNSKLTQILKDSIGAGSKVVMLVHISPSEEDIGETICSLSFVKRARSVESSKDITEELKKQMTKKIAELEEGMREAEDESHKVRNQIEQLQLRLNENRMLYSTRYELREDNRRAPYSSQLDEPEVEEPQQAPKNPTRRNSPSSVPRFMTSTMASRQRQIASEREIVGRAKSLRSTVTTRSSIHLSISQSLSCSDARLKVMIQNSNGKSRLGEVNALLDSNKCSGLDSKTGTFARSKMVTSSDPNLKVTIPRHRRRMSDFM